MPSIPSFSVGLVSRQLLIIGFLRTKGASFKDHPVMQELERVKLYIRKVNAAEQVPTDRIVLISAY